MCLNETQQVLMGKHFSDSISTQNVLKHADVSSLFFTFALECAIWEVH
jgi:hypothetical protein